MRTERDSLGELSVPDGASYGIHTQRSINNFQISTHRWHPILLSAIVSLKKACAQANHKLGILDSKKTDAITKTCNEIIEGKFPDQFPLDVFQAGSGTSTNMNVNEVIANRASEILGGSRGSKLVHPNDDVNKGQSTNDIIPSAIRMATILLYPQLKSELGKLEITLKKKSLEFKDIIKSARTHLQDAVPITLGQEFSAYGTAVNKHIQKLDDAKKYLVVLPIGGNAVGTGLNTHPKFRKLVVEYLNKDMHLDCEISPDGIESVQFLTDLASFSSSMRNLAVDLNKISNDLRLLSSGPHAGLKETNLPAVEPGSSIMPGKINPSILEAVNMASYYVMGNDTTISMACTAGNLDLNTHMPIIGYCLIDSLEIMIHTITMMNEKCIAGITANESICQNYFERSAALATALNPYLGYDKVAELVKESLACGKTVRELVIEKKLLSKDKFESILDPKKLTQPNL